MDSTKSVIHCPNTHIRVIDSIMGSGKSTWIIKDINQQPELRYIYVGKYLNETQRIVDQCQDAHFRQPSEDRFGSKQADFHFLLKDGYNIAITHELFKRLEFSEKEKKIIHELRYRLILDEVPEAIELIPVSNHDRRELFERYVKVGDDGFLIWEVDEYKGNHEEIKRQIKSKAVIDFNNSCFLWLFPIDLLLSFKQVDVLTFLFEGSHMKRYLEIYQLPYSTYHIKEGKMTPGKQDLSDELGQVRSLIHIYEGDLNDIGAKANDLSSTWWKNKAQKEGKVAEKNALNILQNKFRATASAAMWTKFKSEKHCKPKLNGNRLVESFVPFNACATNEHLERKYLAYLVNVYENPLVKNWFEENNVKVDEEAYALSYLVQWVWRSAIRQEEEIHIYIPSRRMRGLLKAFLNGKVIAMAA